MKYTDRKNRTLHVTHTPRPISGASSLMKEECLRKSRSPKLKTFTANQGQTVTQHHRRNDRREFRRSKHRFGHPRCADGRGATGVGDRSEEPDHVREPYAAADIGGQILDERRVV